jgi:hypothetical protein
MWHISIHVSLAAVIFKTPPPLFTHWQLHLQSSVSVVSGTLKRQENAYLLCVPVRCDGRVRHTGGCCPGRRPCPATAVCEGFRLHPWVIPIKEKETLRCTVQARQHIHTRLEDVM